MYFSLFTQNFYYVEKQFETKSKFSYGMVELPLLFLLVFILIFLLVFFRIVRGHGSNDLANGVRLRVDTRQSLQDTLQHSRVVESFFVIFVPFLLLGSAGSSLVHVHLVVRS